MSGNLVTTDWLAQHLDDGNLVVIDASWHLPTAQRDAATEYETGHIPGARFYDLDKGSNPDSALPHMLPSVQKFSTDMQSLGVNPESFVVCYDALGLFSAPRLWWMLRTFGHEGTAVLDGGLPKWLREGKPVQRGLPATRWGRFAGQYRGNSVKSLADVSQALATASAQLADARSPTRFRGEEPEPRPGVRPGHMPGAHNVHYASLLTDDGTLKTGDALRAAFEAGGIDLGKPVITTCGSGVTAAILTLGLAELGIADGGLYDGSWAEWGASAEPVATG